VIDHVNRLVMQENLEKEYAQLTDDAKEPRKRICIIGHQEYLKTNKERDLR